MNQASITERQHELRNRRECPAMMPARPVLAKPGVMLGCTVSDIRFPPIRRIAPGEPVHQQVAHRFRHDTGSRDRWAERITIDKRVVSATDFR